MGIPLLLILEFANRSKRYLWPGTQEIGSSRQDGQWSSHRHRHLPEIETTNGLKCKFFRHCKIADSTTFQHSCQFVKFVDWQQQLGQHASNVIDSSNKQINISTDRRFFDWFVFVPVNTAIGVRRRQRKPF